MFITLTEIVDECDSGPITLTEIDVIPENILKMWDYDKGNRENYDDDYDGTCLIIKFIDGIIKVQESREEIKEFASRANWIEVYTN